MFKNPLSFRGRSRRIEYWISFIILGSLVQLNKRFEPNEDLVTYIVLFYEILILWFYIAQGTKRCHDLGKPGWYLIVPFKTLGMFFLDSEKGANKYGPNPKGINKDESVKHNNEEYYCEKCKSPVKIGMKNCPKCNNILM